MKNQTDDQQRHDPNAQWHAQYWKDAKHGQAWTRVKDAFKRDWEQTKEDVGMKSGKQLHQDAGDTVKQATGKETIPAGDAPNRKVYDSDSRNWDRIEPALAYGVGAQAEYGATFTAWDDKLENKLSTEWDSSKTGMKFDEVKPYVRRGWDGVAVTEKMAPVPPTDFASQIKAGMPVVCSNNGQFAVVDHMEGKNSIKLKKDDQGQHHYIPLKWVTLVDDKVHVDRPGKQAMAEWSTSPTM